MIYASQYEKELYDTAPSEVLPTSEWHPTIGRPEAASGELQMADKDHPAFKWKTEHCEASWDGKALCIPSAYFEPLPQPTNDNDQVAKDCARMQSPNCEHYKTLHSILMDAYDHAATGKGRERHARDLPFDDQPIMQTTRLVGPGFPLGQAIKKAGEAAGMIERNELDAAEAECLGAINYLAGAVAWMRERSASLSE